MYVIRPIQLDDLDALMVLASTAEHGLTTLPKDRTLLETRIRESMLGFDTLTQSPKRGVTFLFAMEDTESHNIVGTCGIVSKVGGFEPFYAYKIVTTEHHSDQLHIHQAIDALHLVEEHNGPTEIGSLFLAPQARQHGIGRALSLSRFLFIAEHREHFDDTVIAEMRGVIDPQGKSPFWNAIGAHFFGIDLPTADYLSSVDKRFIADLMPRHPIYIPMLTKAAQQVIGKVHEKTQPAQNMLEKEGFHPNGMVDIFEAGPMLSCDRDAIRTVRASQQVTIENMTDDIPGAGGTDYIMATVNENYRACSGPVHVTDHNQIHLTRACASTLGVTIGQTLRIAPLRGPRNTRNTRITP